MAKVGFWLVKRASRNRSWLDRRLLGKILRFEFDLYDMVISDRGYDPAELERYQRGE